MKNDEIAKVDIIRQEVGRFDHRFLVGPACWPHFDLLWLHEGAVRLEIGAISEVLEIRAPMGVLIFPNVPFRGKATSQLARASICHFSGGPFDAEKERCNYLLPSEQDAFHIQNLISLSLEYFRRDAEAAVRNRLLSSILDLFRDSGRGNIDLSRLDRAWGYVATHLADIRSLADVGASIGLSESAFRSMHRERKGDSAGRHLQNMRLDAAEQLLATTGDTISEIAKAVGYAHAESFSHAYSKSRDRTPARFRRWCKLFA